MSKMRNRSNPVYVGLIVLGLCLSTQVRADSKSEFAGIYAIYKRGDYSKAIESLHRLSATQISVNERATVSYWLGLCQSRLQNYPQAIAEFRNTQEAKASFEDLDYELGQALYASQDLKGAREVFVRSAFRGYKPGASHYYAGFISQTLNDYHSAMVSYEKIAGLPSDLDKVKQLARFQYAEVQLAQIEGLKIEPSARKSKIREKVIPSFRAAADLDPQSEVAGQAYARIGQIQKQMGLEIPRMHNGVPISEVPWYLKFNEDVKYDSNVTSEANDAVVQVTDKASAIAKTGAFGKYEYIYGKRWAVAPEMDLQHIHHLNQTEPTVFQNDAFSVTAAVRSRNEHFLGKRPGAFLVEFEFNQYWKDVLQAHSLDFYSRHYNLIVGERAKLFAAGSSTLLVNVKLYENTDAGQNATNPGLSFTQNFQLARAMGLRTGLSVDYNRARDVTNDKLNYKLSGTINIPDVFKSVDASAGMDFTFVDTRTQKATRGVEKLIAPSASVTWNASNQIYASLSYLWTKNVSLDTATYAYTKSIFGLGAGYRF